MFISTVDIVCLSIHKKYFVLHFEKKNKRNYDIQQKKYCKLPALASKLPLIHTVDSLKFELVHFNCINFVDPLSMSLNPKGTSTNCNSTNFCSH